MPEQVRPIGPDGRRRPGPIARLSLDLIVSTALRENIATVTIPQLAAALGTSHTALYRYVDSGNGLRLACLAEIARRMDWPADHGSWADRLRALAECLWQALDRYPGMAHCLATTQGAAAMAARPLEMLHGQLMRCGLSKDQATMAIDFISDTMVITHIEVAALRQAFQTGESAAAIELWQKHADSDIFLPDASWQDRGFAIEKIELIIIGLRTRYQLS